MASTFTTNLNLRKPEHRDPETFDSWSYVLNSDFDLIDAAFGNRTYTEQNYIANSDSHSQSINKLDMKLADVNVLTPSINEKSALVGPTGYSPNVGNPYATMSYVTGLAPIARKIILAPEYLGSVLWNGGAAPTLATLTTDFEFDASIFGYNFYQWVSTKASWETYWAVVRWKAPESFVGFNLAANQALILDCCYEDIGTDAAAGVVIYKDDMGGISSTAPAAPLVTVGGIWYSERVGNEKIYFDATDMVLSTISAGDVLIIMVGMQSQNNKWVKVGDLTIQYTG